MRWELGSRSGPANGVRSGSDWRQPAGRQSPVKESRDEGQNSSRFGGAWAAMRPGRNSPGGALRGVSLSGLELSLRTMLHAASALSRLLSNGRRGAHQDLLPARLPDGHARVPLHRLQAGVRAALLRKALYDLQAGVGRIHDRPQIHGLPAGLRATLPYLPIHYVQTGVGRISGPALLLHLSAG